MLYGSTKFLPIVDCPAKELGGESLWARLERVETFAVPDSDEPLFQRRRTSEVRPCDRETNQGGEGLLGLFQSFFRRAA